ncbi:hypothetical protein [Caballeronia sp. NCTM1]|uniref:hypothetical protein n=1 Tax=Caballeronia sp. NCTM1 TaxID=2921753 RepID=UPI002028C81A|nr:hypothetical protein [Caballeronia sp. NCTM1]
MFGLKSKRLDRDRAKQEFDRVTSSMRQAPEAAQMVFGHSINVLFHLFLARFGSSLAFQARPYAERSAYVKSLTKMKDECQQIDPLTSLACGLVKLWIGTLMVGDPPMAKYFFDQLMYFGNKDPS